MKTTKYILTLVLTAWCAVGNLYAVEKSYYNSVDGKKDSGLREALTTLTYTKHTTDVGYNWTFDGIDIVNGVVLDMYSTCSWTEGDDQGKNVQSQICWTYNREHVVPQNVFSEQYPQRSDRHHLFLTDAKVNGMRSNYAFGETNVTTAFNSITNGEKALGKLGTSSNGYTGKTVYEPDDEYKGDIARAVLYMAVRYATNNECRKYNGSTPSTAYPVTTWYTNNPMFSNSLSTNYGLSNDAVAIFLKWHRNDPVSAKEVARNNGVEKKQGNRNPFIDLPDLVEYLWGNKAGQTVNLSGLDIATGGGSVPSTYEVTLNRNGVTETITCSGTYTLPTSSTEANACEGWAFAGWTETSSVSGTSEPTWKTSVTGATTLYAVYSHTESGAPHRAKMADVTDELTYSLIGVTGTSYSDWEDVSDESDAVYAGQSAGGNSSIQLRSKNSNSGIITTTSGGKVKSIAVEWNSNTTNGATLNVYGKNSAYSSASDLFGSSKGTSLGTIVKGTSTSISVTGDYEYIGLCSNSGAMYLDKVSITWSSGGSTTTTTYKTSPTCGTSHSITLSSGGAVTGGTFEASASSAYQGATITLYADPSDGYAFGSWSVTKQGGGSVTVTDNQFTMPDANVTVSATFNALPTYNIRFYNNGTQIGSTQSVYQGGTPNIPSVDACEGYTFVGWWTAELGTTNTTAKSWIEDFTATANKEYYAIFSKTEGGSGSSTVTFGKSDFSGSGTISASKSNVSVSCVGNIPNSGTYVTFTENNTLTISSTSGNITAIDFTCSGDDYTGNMTDVSDISTSSWSITVNNPGNKTTVRVSSIVVTIGSSGTTYYTSTTSCASACTTLATPEVTATPGNGQITLTWQAVADADHYTVTINKGAGYTTECGSAASIGSVTGSTTKTCVITGLTNGLTYTTNVVANATSSTCDSDADTDTATPQDCTPWDDPTLSWNKYSLNTTTNKTATKSLSGTTHGTLSFESSNTDVLTVNETTGAVTAVGAGEATVTAHWTANGGYCEKTMTSSTFEVAGPLTISFDANADGVTGTMTDQTVTYKESTAIKDNAFKREGYSFIGWATSADGEKVYNDKQSVAFTNSQTLYAVWQLNSRTVSFTSSITGATVTVNGQTTNQTVAYGSTVTVHITPANHYTITTVSIKGATSGNDIAQTGSGETRTFTMPDENVTVSVTMSAESTYTATFYNSGVAYGDAQTGYADDDINAPATNPVSCDADEFTFVGWVAAEQTSETTTKPEVLTFPQTMPVGNVNYYALYRRVEGSGGGEATVTFLTASSDGNTAYTEDDEIKENLVESYTGISSFAGNKAYLGKSGVKLGASGGTGYITLNLSSPITTNTITVSAAKYGTDTGNLQIEVNGSTSFGDKQSPADGTLTFTNASDVEISDLTISTTSKRAYVASISLGGGGTSYYTTSPVCTPCDYHVTLTKGAETNGTFTLSKTNGTYDNCKTNFAVTVSNIVPATGYYCSGVSATGGSHVIVSEPDANGNYTVSFPKGNTVTSTVTAVFEEIPSHTVTWSANGNTSNTASYKEGATITFPESATGCDGMEFKGWSAVEVEPQDYAPEYTTSATMGTEDITFYAVFATASSGSGGEEGWSETAITDLTSSDIFVIVGNNGSNYAMTNDNGTGSAPAATGVTVSDGKITSTVADNLKWNISGNTTNGYVFYPNGSTTTWLYCTNTNNGVRVGTNNSKTFTIDDGYLKHSGTSRYVGIYNSADWRCYTSNGGNIDAQSFKFYKYSAGSGSTTYSGYTTSCTPCEKQVNIVKGSEVNGSYALSLTGAQDNCHSAGVVVTVTDITATGDYQFKEITQVGIATGVTIDNDAKTVTYAKDVTGTSTITVVFEPKPTYTVRFFDSGTKIFDQQVVEGKTFTKPSNPAGCAEYTFVGWWASELNTENTTSYSWLNSFGAVYANQTYYAVYEHTEGGSIEQVYSKSPSGSGDLVANGAGTEYTLTIATGVTVTISGWSNNVPVYHSDGQWRIYAGSNVVIASTLGNISKIQFSSTQNNLSTSQGSYSSQVWTGDASSVTFTNSATQSRITGISVTVGGGGTTYYTTSPSCLPKVETPTFSVPGGEYSAAQSVTISCVTSGASIYYTLDGSTPTTSSTLYTAAVTIPKGAETTLKAIAVKDGMSPSAVATATYDIRVYDIILSRSGNTESIANVAHGTSLDAIDGDGDQGGCANWTFVGWSRTTVNPGDTYTPVTTVTASGVYYAVYNGSSGGNPVGWYKISSTDDLVAGDHYIFVGVTDDKNYVMTNTYNGSANTMNTAQINETSAGYYAADAINGNYVYYLSGSSNSWQIRNVQTDKYVDTYYTEWYTTTNDEYDTYTFSQNGSYWSVICKYGTNKYLSFNASSKVFSGNSSTSNNLLIYHYGTPGGTVNSTSTDCCDEVNAPEVTLIARSTTATISWNKQAGATNGYNVLVMQGSDVAFEQNYGKNVTTCEVTGLITNTAYTYTVTAKGATCNRATTGNFTTPGCDDVPYDITVTPYNVVQAIIRWKATAERAKVVVYKDEACTQIHANIADTISPCYVSDLAESTRYWFKVFGGESQDCASPVQTFLTQTTAVELVEWRDTAIVILLTGDETTASVLLEGKDDLHQETTTSYADSIFFSKYFEAASNTKLLAVFNGTNHNVNIADYKLAIAQGSTTFTQTRFDKMKYYTSDESEAYFTDEQMLLTPGSEMILITYPTGNAADAAIIKCAQDNPNSHFESYYRLKSPSLQFNGDDAIGLVNPQGELIDLIGAGTLSGSDVSHVDATNQSGASGGSYHGFMDKPGGWYNEHGYHALNDGTETNNYALSTNRCLLIRRNYVKSGLTAVARNTEDFITLGDYTHLGENYEGEWKGVQIPGAGCESGNCEGVTSACGQFDHVGSYDYQEYYASFEPVDTIENLTKNEDGTITIPIPGLETMSCSMLRVNVYDTVTGDLKASREYRVPIIIQKGEVKSTNKLFTKHGVAVCKECDVLVFNGATLKKDNVGEDRDTIGNLTLYPGSTLELPSGKGDYHVKSLTYRVEGDNVPITKLNDSLYSETQQLTVTRRIKNDRYYFISFPYDVNVNEITLANGSKAVNGKDFRLMEYDAEARAAEGSLQGAPGHWKLFTGDKLTAGQGYAIAVNTKAMKEIMFPMTIPSKNLTNAERTKVTNTVDINEYIGAARNTNHNWNLIAHPYITKFEVTSATSVEAYWENPSRQDSAWVDDWTTWPEEDPTQPTDTTHTQNPDSTETHIGDILESGTVDNGLVWVLYANATMELTGGGQMVDFSSLEAVPWAQHRQFIKDLKIGGDVQKIGKYAFSQCTNLVTVTIAAPVTNLASYAFAGCTQLRSFRIESTQYISATTATFDGVSTLSVYVPQSMYDQYSQNTPWNKMALSAFDGSSTTGGDGSNTNPTPRRVAEHPEGWTESAGGIYVTVPIVVDGKVDYEQHWINDVDDIKPFTAVFIQGDGKGQMTFNMYPATPAPKRMWQADRYETRDHTVFVGLTINGNGHKDMTSLRLRPDFTEDYKLNLDLLKFTTFYTSRPQIYFKTEKDQLAFRAVSDSLAANTWLPVGVYCRDAGEYTFALHDRYVWDEVEAVYLRDNVTGAETNLLMGNYTITTTGQIYTNTRFAVKVLLRRKVKDTPTMIDHTEDPNAPRKFFRDGLLYIMRDGKVYDLTGKPVQFDDLLNR